jgi:hypothetical protein
MDLGSGIRKKPIPDPGSRGQKGTGSRIRLRNTGLRAPVCYFCRFSGMKVFSIAGARRHNDRSLDRLPYRAFFSESVGARNQVGMGLSYRPVSLCCLATQFQAPFLESFLAS